MKNREGILIVISGFAGTGKGTIVKRLLEESDRFALSVSMTTRNPRPGEQEGISYFFASKEKFEETIKNDGFIEYACYCDNYYGTPKEYVENKLAEGKDVILEIEIQGAMNIKEKYPNALLLFVLPPSGKVLKERLVGRGTETMDVVDKRMKRASQEAMYIEKYDYIVVNDDIDECVKDTMEIVNAAKNKPVRNEAFIQELQEELKSM